MLTIEDMSPEESVYKEESNGDEDDQTRGAQLKTLVIKRHQWWSDESTKEFQSLDRKAKRARSKQGKLMVAKREVERGAVPNRNSSHHPKRGASMGP